MEIKTLASGSRGNCYRISDGSTSLLIEAGIPLKDIKKGLNFKLSQIDACFASHEHGDHSKSLQDVMQFGIPTYASKGTFDSLGLTEHYNAYPVQSKKQYCIGSFVIMPFDVQHDAREPLGFVMKSMKTNEKLLFATDTYMIKYKFKGLNYIMIECNYSMDTLDENITGGYVNIMQKPRLLMSHFNLDNVIKFLKANDLSQVKEIHLLHLSSRNSDEKLFKRKIQEVTGKPVYIAKE